MKISIHILLPFAFLQMCTGLNEHDVNSIQVDASLRRSIITDLNSLTFFAERSDQTLCQERSKTFHTHLNTCYCDQNCHRFGDCCIDQVVSTESKYKCEQFGVYPLYYYMLRKCDYDFNISSVVRQCETDSKALKRPRPNSLHDVPIYYDDIPVLFKNYYCLMCSGEVPPKNIRFRNIYKWHYNIVWMSPPAANSSFTLDDVRKRYDPKTRQFMFMWEGHPYTVSFDFQEIYWGNFSVHFHTRVCHPVVSRCPNDASDDLKAKCGSYTLHMYNKVTEKEYKNYHCAKCNGESLDNLVLGLTASTRYTSPQRNVWYPGIFELPFESDKDCTDKEYYDSVLDKCLKVKCPTGLRYDGKYCVAENDTRSCPWVSLDPNWVTFLDDGSIYVNYTKKVIPSGKYEKSVDSQKNVSNVYICIEPEPEPVGDIAQEVLSEICLMISIACLLLQLIIYSLMKNLRSRAGKILMCLSASLLGGHISFMAASTVSYFTKSCYVVAVFTHLFYLASVFWMNVMAVDVCRLLVTDIFDLKRTKLFLLYNLYAWLTPLLIVIIAIVVDKAVPGGIVSPHYGQQTCWLGHRNGLLLFFYSPVGLLLIINLILFTMTLVSLRRMRMKSASAKNQFDRNKFNLAMKLGIVFGLTWSFGFLAALTRVHGLWYPFIIFNGLQGAFIFFAFTFRNNVYTEARSSWNRLTTSGTRVSSLLESFRKSGRRRTEFDRKARWASDLRKAGSETLSSKLDQSDPLLNKEARSVTFQEPGQSDKATVVDKDKSDESKC